MGICAWSREREGAAGEDDAPLTLQPLDPMHDKTEAQTGRANRKQFRLFVLVDREHLCTADIAYHQHPKR